MHWLMYSMYVRSSVTLSEAVIDYTVLSLAEVDQRVACWGHMMGQCPRLVHRLP